MTQKIEYTQDPWSLKDLFDGYDDPKYESLFDEIKQGVEAFQAFREQLKADINEDLFKDIITTYEQFYRRMSRLNGFVQLAFAADTQDQKAQAEVARVDQFQAEVGNQTIFFSLWWKALDNENAQRLLAASGDYSYWLVAMRNFKDYTLSEPEEKIINIKDVTGVNALNMLYDSITNRYVFEIEVDGEEKKLTRGELSVLVREPNPDLRARAYKTLFKVYEKDAPILGQIYQAIVRDWRNENIDLRGFKTPRGVRNLINDIPDTVIDTLLDVTRQNAKHFQRFFRLKAKRIGMEKLRRYDIYAPVTKSDKKYSYNDAADIVMESSWNSTPSLLIWRKKSLMQITSTARSVKARWAAHSVPPSHRT